MGTRRPVSFVLASVILAVVAVTTRGAAQTPAAVNEGPTQEANASSVMLPCIPVGAYWTGPPPSEGMPPGPNLAVVSIDVRPKDARVHLDGRFVGRARYLDGKPGYLYLEPGSYELELRHEGYRTVLAELEAQAACRYDMKHRLERGKGSSRESEKEYGKGRPFNRVYGPLVKGEAPVASSKPAGPDPSLRKDLNFEPQATGAEFANHGAALRLRITPGSATVSIDGTFAATARELGLMEGPLAVAPGKHRVVVRAPGYLETSRDVELSPGEVLELEIALSENRTN